MIRFCLPLALLVGCLGTAVADYEYRYVEGEAFARGEAQGLRDEGFTSWMAHPSGGKVAVFGRPAGGFLEYDLKGLLPGDYSLYVRCLALPSTRTHLLWDGKDLGLLTQEVASTSLRWCRPFTVTGPGDHVLRLQGGEEATQWPYIDALLLTNQPGYTPPAKDADFVSFTTPWPLLTLTGTPTLTVAPQPPAAGAAAGALRFEKLQMAPPVLGRNDLQLTLSATAALTVALQAGLGRSPDGPAVEVSLQPGAAQTITLPATADSAGDTTLTVCAALGAQRLVGTWTVTVPPPATIALDEYAYPLPQAQGHWQARFACAAGLLPRLQAEVTVEGLDRPQRVLQQTLAARPEVTLALPLAALPVGRYAVSTRVLLDGRPALTDRREFIRYEPVAWPTLEPVRESRAAGDTVLVNGKPFLGRLLYHAPITARTAAQGYNLVQCYGGDPDPLPGIQKCLDDARQAGLYGTVALFNNRYFNEGPQFDLAHIEQAVVRFRNHPAVWGWDLIDEPEPTMKPEAVQAAADLVRKLDPNHLVWVNLCRNTSITDYLGSQDLWSFDYYPFPTLTPFSFRSAWLDQSDKLLAGKKPLGTCLQTFNYNWHEVRMPTPDELRTSAWLHIIHGYKWFGYYSFYDGEPAGCLNNTPQLWSYTRALNSELVRLQDVILAPGQWRPVPLEPASGKVEAREKQVGGKWYVVVVSDSREPQTLTLKPTRAQGPWRLLTESGGATGGAVPLRLTLRPLATQVWESGQR